MIWFIRAFKVIQTKFSFENIPALGCWPRTHARIDSMGPNRTSLHHVCVVCSFPLAARDIYLEKPMMIYGAIVWLYEAWRNRHIYFLQITVCLCFSTQCTVFLEQNVTHISCFSFGDEHNKRKIENVLLENLMAANEHSSLTNHNSEGSLFPIPKMYFKFL